MKYRPKPKRLVEFTHGAGPGSTSTGAAINLFSNSRAKSRGESMVTVSYKNTGVKIILGVG